MKAFPSKTFSNIAIRYFPIKFNFILKFSYTLKKKYNSKIYYYTDYPDSLKVLKKYVPKYFDEIIVMFPEGRRIQKKLEETEIFKKCRALEARYNKSINYFVLLDRINGRSFSPAGYYIPRSEISSGDYLSVLNKNISWIEFWENELRKRDISLLINPLHIESNVCRKFKIKSFMMMPSKYKNHYFWSDDEFGYSKKIEKDFTGNNKFKKIEFNLDSEPYYQSIVRKIYKKRKNFSYFLFRVLRKIYQHSYWIYKGMEKKYNFTSEVYSYFKEYRDFNYLLRNFNHKINFLKDKKYVFYALQDEPETNFQGRSPEYFYQLSCIISISRDLPADTFLVVKEHISAVGKRPIDFYSQISELKNVIFINILERGIDIARNAKLVITICGTIGFEAALMGIPVISFGRHNLYNLLDHVKVVKSEESIKPAIDYFLNKPLDKVKAMKSARRLLDSIVSNSFDMKKFSYLDSGGFEDSSVTKSLKLLEKLCK